MADRRTADRPARRRAAGTLRASEAARFLWTQLTSMRTALVLLFALALAAIPGSLLPQRPTSPVRVREFIAENPQLGGFYDAVGLFDVYASPWFAAIYLLLFVSLVGCIIPRIGVYLRGFRAQPPVSSSAPTAIIITPPVTCSARWCRFTNAVVAPNRSSASPAIRNGSPSPSA